METQIDIEQFDNGYTLRAYGDEGDLVSIVVLDADIESQLGKMILEDVKHIQDREMTNKVKMEIKYEPINE